MTYLESQEVVECPNSLEYVATAACGHCEFFMHYDGYSAGVHCGHPGKQR